MLKHTWPIVVAASLFVGGCTKPSSTAPRTPAQPPATEPPLAKPPNAKVEPPIARLRLGGWPSSNTHQWGMRFIDLQIRDDGTTRVRIHDEISFQGSGMQPEDMPPTRHACTRWEVLPDSIEVPASLPPMSACADQPLCKRLESWFVATQPPPPQAPSGTTVTSSPGSSAYGRSIGGCEG
jgi:hypothetical protein